MMQSLIKSRKKVAIFFFAIFICFSFILAVQPALVQAAEDPATSGYYGLNSSAPEALKTSKSVDSLPSRVGVVIGIVLSFIGVIFFILIIYAGVMWMTSVGNEQQVGKAKEIIIAAVIGLVIVLSAYAITNFVGTNLAN